MCTGPERRRSEVCAKKNRRQILSRTDRANEVNETFIIWLLVHCSLEVCNVVFVFKSLPLLYRVSFFVSLLVYTNSAFIYRVVK